MGCRLGRGSRVLHPRDLLHPHDCTICEVSMREPILEMKKLNLSRMKRNFLEIPRLKPGFRAVWPDSKVLSSATLLVPPRSLPQGGQCGEVGGT